MKILVLSNDEKIISALSDPGNPAETIFFKDEAQLWTIMEKLASHAISLIIVDDDLVRPNSERIIRMLKQLRENVNVIFITSDRSIDLGKRISQLGIDFYGHKPFKEQELCEALSSILRLKTKQPN